MPTKSIIEDFERDYNRKKVAYLDSIKNPAVENFENFMLELTDPFKEHLKESLTGLGKEFKVTTKKGISEIVDLTSYHRIQKHGRGYADLGYNIRNRLDKNTSIVFSFNVIVEFNLKDSVEYQKLIDAKKFACEEEKRLYHEIREWARSQEMKSRSAALEEYHGLDDVEFPQLNKIECNESDL